ncbi:MAG: hypothetical protein HY001_02260 [Candidatus Portnoybacteria bacterium]|nr:hypothetical protein [Candidatus Portnoybacteria bacterium]
MIFDIICVNPRYYPRLPAEASAQAGLSASILSEARNKVLYKQVLMKEVLETTKFAVEKSKFVHINLEAINKVAGQWKKENWQLPPWDFGYHFFDNSPRTLTYFFILDSINFSFWTQKPHQKYRRVYQGKELGGHDSLALSLKLAFQRHNPIEKIEHLIKIRKGEFLKILGGKGELPLLEKRLHVLHQNALILKKKFQGEFAHAVEQAKGDVLKLVELLITNFPSFNDATKYPNFAHDREQSYGIAFYKRAQLLVNDIYTVFKGEGLGKFTDMDKLTAFADYKIPQILRHWSILEYEKRLASKVDAKIQLQKSSREEIEIRASTIWAVEYLKEELEKQGISLESREIDWFLWKRAREEKGMKPHHRVRTIYY